MPLAFFTLLILLTPAATLGYYDLQNMTDKEYKSYSKALQTGNNPAIDINSLIPSTTTTNKPFFDTSNVMLPGEELTAAKSDGNGFWHNMGVSVANGFYGQLRGLLGVAKGGIEQNIARAKKENKDYVPYSGASSVLGGLNAAIANIEHQDVKGDTPAEQLAYDLTEGAVQLAMQLLVAKGAGAGGAALAGKAGYSAKKAADTAQFAAKAGSSLYMGANIAGDQYISLRKEGVDVDRAVQASLMNAPAQAVLEGLGIGKILEKLPANSTLKKKILDIGIATVQEGVTEGLQSLPEQLTNIWAKDANATPESVLNDWWKNRDKNIREMGYSALLGGILGGGAKGIHVLTETTGEKIAQSVIEEKKAVIEKNIEIIQKSKVNPELAAEYIDANSEGDVVVVEAKALQDAYKQSTDGESLLELLDVTAEEVNESAAVGQDMEITRGKYTAAAAKEKGFFETTKEGMYFDTNGEITVKDSERLKDLREGYKLSDEAVAELDAELNGVIDSALKAGMKQTHAENLRLMLESRAIIANPENPAAWLQKNKLRFQSGSVPGPLKSGWLQAAFAYNFSNMKAFKDEIARTPRDRINKLSYKYRGKNGGWYEVLGSNFGHVDKNAHPLTDEQWDDALSKLDNADNIELMKIADKPGRNGGVVVGQVVNGDLGKYGILLEVMKNGRVFVTTSGMNGTPNMNAENWIKNIRGSQTLQHKAIKLNTGKMGQTSYIKMIQQKLGIVKNWYKQQNATIDKGMFSPMDDGAYVITLFKAADASTIIHETGHYFVDTMVNEALADPENVQLNKDVEKLLAYVSFVTFKWTINALYVFLLIFLAKNLEN